MLDRTLSLPFPRLLWTLLVLAMMQATALIAVEPTAAQTGNFPIRLEHVFGEATIKAPPERVVAWDAGSADAVVALGPIPLAVPFQPYGGGHDGVTPWAEEAFAQVPGPLLLPRSREIPHEQIAELNPDIIFAMGSDLTQEQYQRLSAIAPTVARPRNGTPITWQATTRIVGQALGLSAQSDAFVRETEAWLAAELAARSDLREMAFNPEHGKDAAFQGYVPLDPRTKLKLELGLHIAGMEYLAAVSPPSALSVRWVFGTYLDVLETADDRVLSSWPAPPPFQALN